MGASVGVRGDDMTVVLLLSKADTEKVNNYDRNGWR